MYYFVDNLGHSVPVSEFAGLFNVERKTNPSSYTTPRFTVAREVPMPFDLFGAYHQAFMDSGSNGKNYYIWKSSSSGKRGGVRFTKSGDNISVYLQWDGSASGSPIFTYSLTNLPGKLDAYFCVESNAGGQWLFYAPEVVQIMHLYISAESGSDKLYGDMMNPTETEGIQYLIPNYDIATNLDGNYFLGTPIPDIAYLLSNTQMQPLSSFVNFNGLKSEDGGDPTHEEPTPPAPEDPNDEGEPSDEDGGDGDHDPTYDPIPIPNKPTQGASTAGFLTMYKLSQGHMQQFGEDMFASNVWEAIKLFFSNPIDFLVGIMLLPFEPTGGSSYKPKFGAISFARAYPTVANQYHDIDCGSITITKYWGSFLDYAPYTKIQIWLPYIGYRDLDVDEIMGNTINVKYRCDCVTGDCVAFVYVGVVGETGPQIPRVIAQFYGNCGVQIPFGSVTYDQAVMAGIEMLGTAANWGLSGGSAMLDSESFAAYNVNAVNASKPEVQKGGGAGSTVGYMSIQKPYIIRKIARQNLPADYMQFKGYPSNISGILADFEGFAKVDDIQLNNIPAMETEREEIVSLLRGGVLL